MFISQPIPADDAMLAIAPPSTRFGITASVRCRSPQKFTSMTSRFENVFGQPGAVEEHVDDLADLRDGGVDLVGLAQVGLGEARQAGQVGLLDVDRVDLGAELDE